MVGLVARLSNLALLSKTLRHDVNSETDLTARFDGAALALTQEGCPECVLVVLVEVDLRLGVNHAKRLHVLPVLLVEDERLLGQGAVVDNLLEVYLSGAQHVIAAEHVPIINLDRVLVVLRRMLEIVDETVLEVGLAVLAAPMGVCLEHLTVGVEEAAAVGVGRPFDVTLSDVLAVEHAHSDFHLVDGLGRDVPLWDLLRIDRRGNDFDPAANLTLRELTRRNIQTTRLDGLVDHGVPVDVEETVLKVNNCRTDQVITKDRVVVPYSYLERRAAWEVRLERIHLVEHWRRIVKLIVVALRDLLAIQFEDQVRVTVGSIVSLGQVEAIQHEHAHDAVSLREQTSLENIFRVQV